MLLHLPLLPNFWMRKQPTIAALRSDVNKYKQQAETARAKLEGTLGATKPKDVKLCHHFRKGNNCSYGDNCNYGHYNPNNPEKKPLPKHPKAGAGPDWPPPIKTKKAKSKAKADPKKKGTKAKAKPEAEPRAEPPKKKKAQIQTKQKKKKTAAAHVPIEVEEEEEDDDDDEEPSAESEDDVDDFENEY